MIIDYNHIMISARIVMAAMSDIPGLELEELILKRREEGFTYPEISEELCAKFPGERGFSSRSVRRFCEEHGIRRSSYLSQKELSKVVATAVNQVREPSSVLSCGLVTTVSACSFDLPAGTRKTA